ncbi:hypothetical protein ABT282_07370 [Streptomyces sp. NPDC000927]|uniref:hypothetical protein n=1 Tax=Streptomyces sp. NPDC000927 TaxID=3154371 RepID=UPI0033348833
MMRHYKISTENGTAGFLCPPKHPRHQYSLNEYTGPKGRTVQGSYAIDYALSPEAAASPEIVAQVKKIMEQAVLEPSEPWIQEVYGYFRNMWVPESGSRNASDLTSYSPASVAHDAAGKALTEAFKNAGGLPWVREGGEGAADAKSYRDGSRRPLRAARRGYEVTAKGDGSKVYVYALADDGTRYGALPVLGKYAEALTEAGYLDVRIEEPKNTPGAFTPERVVADVPNVPEPMDPERHAAVAHIREYFPDHEPRVDLIENPGKGYGSYPCDKCGEKVQYEAKFDKLAIVSTRASRSGVTQWSYGTECAKGGDHAVA